jgi:hypothetical protein
MVTEPMIVMMRIEIATMMASLVMMRMVLMQLRIGDELMVMEYMAMVALMMKHCS